MFWKYLLVGLGAYLVGMINPSYLIGRLRGFDIRKRGSGNAGASNAVITMGKAVGIFSMVFDILKATAAVVLSVLLFPELSLVREVAGLFCVLGHIFPVYMCFKGGKGLASFGGMILALDWRVFLAMLAGEAVVLAVTNYLCFVPITAAICFPLIWGLRTGHWQAGVVFIPLALVMTLRHVGNLKRIRHGEELHFSYLWNKDAEMKKITVSEDAEKGPGTDGNE